MNVKNEKIAFAVLIGGKSTRFGSDKGIFEFEGRALLSHQLDTLYKFNSDIFIVAHSVEQMDEYKQKIHLRENVRFILDDLHITDDKDLRTPMIGLYTVFTQLSKEGYKKVFAFSCDTPLIKYEVIELMVNQPSGYDCHIPRWDNGFLEPLFAIYPVEKALINAVKNIKKQKYKLINLLSNKWSINYVSIEHLIKPLDKKLISFINVNGPIDLERLKDNFIN